MDRCCNTITSSGLPDRLRPGFWDNNGRCCGTAGVLALALDRVVEVGDSLSFADLLVDDLTARATVDAAGARWSNYEYQATPPELTRTLAGRWETLESSPNSSATHESVRASQTPTRPRGPTIHLHAGKVPRRWESAKAVVDNVDYASWLNQRREGRAQCQPCCC